MKNKASEKLDKVKNNKYTRALGNAWNSKPIKMLRGRNSLASAIGIAAGLASYAGNGNAATAVGAGNAAYQSADAFLSSSANTIGNNNSELIEKRNENKKEDLSKLSEEREKVEKDLETSKENLEESKKELEQEEKEEKERQLEASGERMKEYKDAGAYEQYAEERSNYSKLASGEVSSSKLEEMRENIKKQEEAITQKEEALATIDQEMDILQSEINCGENNQSMERFNATIKELGDRGEYIKGKSKAYDAMLLDLKVALDKIGMSSSLNSITTSIEKQIAGDPGAFDLEAMLQRCLGNSITQHESYAQIRNATRQLENFEYDSNLYNNLKLATDMNVTLENISKKTVEHMK